MVLEPFAGSGPLGFLALRLGASRADIVDINSRAISFLEHNARLNGFDPASYSIIEQDIRSFHPDEPYHLIVANPPFVPVPPKVFMPIHSDGGRDGTELSSTVLRNLKILLKEEGELLFSTFQLEKDGEPLLAEVVRETVNGRTSEFTRMRPKSFSLDLMVKAYQEHVSSRREEITTCPPCL